MSEEKILAKLVELDGKISSIQDNMVTKEEYRKDQQELSETLEHIVITVDRLDSERLVAQEQLERHEKDIGKLKENLSIS